MQAPHFEHPYQTDHLSGLTVEYRPITTLKPHPRNPRTHSKKQVRKIADSINAFGWTNPILIDDNGGVIAGHGRIQAAELLGITTVPTIRIEHLTEAQKHAYILADNRLAEEAGWDRDLLTLELKYVIELDASFDLTLTGFEMGEIDVLIDEPPDTKADALPPIDTTAPLVSQPGDLWMLGRHRLLCGDALKPESYVTLMGNDRAQMVFTDPPYNVPIDGHVCGLGGIKHREFAMAAGEMSETEFIAFLNTVFARLTENSVDGAIHYVCMDWRHVFEVMSAARPVYAEFKNLCVWAKGNGGMGAFYRSQHELVFVLKHGSAPHVNNFELGQHGRYRTNVWQYPGISSMGAGRTEALKMHPTVKPVAMVADAIKDCSKRNGIILDPFAGSGTTVIAAEQTGRIAYAMELDPIYVDTAIRRWQELTGEAAILTATGQSFEQRALEREWP